MTNTPNSGAADLPEALTADQWLDLAIRHANKDWNSAQPDGYANAVKALCADFAALTAQDPSQPGGFDAGDMASAAAQGYRDGWTAAQAVAEPGTAYAAALDTLFGAIMGAAYDFRDAHLSGSGNIKRHAHAELESTVRSALAASHGQASSQAGEYPALVCDYCGALTPDPWHSSGMLHGKMSKHIHSCDACAARGAAQAAPVVAATWQPIVSAPKDGKAILLRSKNGRIADGLWSAANSHAGFWAWAYVHQEPVEWMPKPGSPAARAQEQQP